MSEEKKYEELVLEDATYKTMVNVMYRRRKAWQPANEKHVLSYIPGTVIAINVKVGQKVTKGEEIMMYKAMKMDNRILSPMDGTIKAISVKLGESLPKGTLMFEFV